MAKEFLEELLEALQEQKDREINEFYNKLDDGELPGIPMNIISVTKTFYRVALKHQITKQELSSLLSATEPTRLELKNLMELPDDQ